MESFQNDADIIRHRHLKYYAGILKEYSEIKGAYPFTGISETRQTYVFIANSRQAKYAENPPYPINRIPADSFFAELETVLGKEVKECYDPQFAPDRKPNFYMYMTLDTNFYLAIHVSKPYPYARKIDKGYYKIEMTNDKYSIPQKLIEVDEVLGNPAFLHECIKTPLKAGFFADRERQFLKDSKSPDKKE